MKSREILTALLLVLFASASFAAPKQVKSITPGPRGTVLLFVSSMCPCTDAHRQIVSDLINEARPQGFEFYCVFPNDGETKDLAEYFFRNIGWQMPYMFDRKYKLTDQYHVTNTPECIVLSPEKQLLFRGPIDDSSKNQGRVVHAYLNEAVHAILSGQTVQNAEIPPTGCWIVRDTEPRAEIR